MADHELTSGLIRLHVLHHASERPVFGLWMIDAPELAAALGVTPHAQLAPATQPAAAH